MPTGRRNRLWIWGPVLAHMAIIFVASSIPELGPLPGGVDDKSGHTIGYGILGGLLLRAFAGGRLSGVTWRRAAAVIMLATIYGVSDELHQWFVPGRSPDVLDVVADFVGATVVVLLAAAVVAVGRAWGILDTSPGP